MTIRLGIVMDSVESINPKKDSSVGLLLEALKRGWSVDCIEIQHLMLEKNIPTAYVRTLTKDNTEKTGFKVNHFEKKVLTDFNLVLMRKDPPVDQNYLHATQILSFASDAGLRVINAPQSLRDYNEKLFALKFPEYCPPTLVTASKSEAKQFLAQQEDVIVKPLDGMGGHSIFRLKKEDFNQSVIFETLTANGQYILIQSYVPEIKTHGDKRIILIDGHPIPFALARFPASGETRANLAAGGQGIAVPLSSNDLKLCQTIGPYLKKKRLLWVGLDVIGRYLTEINITSPTCIRELEAQCHLNINEQILDCMANQLNS